MATAIRPISHEDRLSLVDHLDELRTRLIISAVALGIAFGLCFWQNHQLLSLVNRPEVAQTRKQVQKGEGLYGPAVVAQKATVKLAKETAALASELSAPDSGLSATVRARLAVRSKSLSAAVAQVPATTPGDKLVTLGIGEPFTTTVLVSLVFALIFSLPVILYELYGFILPAFSPPERRMVRPLVSAIPLLFIAGVLFGYFVVLPAAIHFFVNFNSSEFSVLVQANQYYKFAVTVLLAMGLIFQVPVAIVGATRAGIVTPAQLRKGRRYAVLVCAAVAAFIPGDAITLALETIPLYLLYELSILVAAFVARREAKRARVQEQRAAPGDPPDDPSPGPGGNGLPPDPPRSPTGGASSSLESEEEPVKTSVQQIIDHVDRELLR